MIDNEKSSRATASGFVFSLVVPCYNEEDVLPETYRRICATFDSLPCRLELVLIDDGSTDRTAALIDELALADERVRLVHFSRNFGHQAAVGAGLAAATGRVVAVIDADLQDPPEVLVQFLDKWRSGFDVVYGIRTKRKEAFWKRAAYDSFYRLFSMLASIDAPLDAGDFCLIDRAVADEVNRLPEKNRFFRGLRAWGRYRQAGVVYERDARAAGESKYSLLKLFKLAADGMFNFSTVPLTIVFILGSAMAALSFLALFVVLLLRVFDVSLFGYRIAGVEGFASIILTVLAIGGIQLICVGVLGEYIGRIYQEVKARPTYVVRGDTPVGRDGSR